MLGSRGQEEAERAPVGAETGVEAEAEYESAEQPGISSEERAESGYSERSKGRKKKEKSVKKRWWQPRIPVPRWGKKDSTSPSEPSVQPEMSSQSRGRNSRRGKTSPASMG